MVKIRTLWLGCLLGGCMLPALASGDPSPAPALHQEPCQRQEQPPGPAQPATRLLERYLHLLAACVECEDNLRARVRALSLQHRPE